MGRYLFLLAWAEGSDSACGDKTRVHERLDLYPEFMKGNEFIFAVDIHAPNKDIATAFGFQAAFHENYTACDSASICIEIDESMKFPLDAEDELVRITVTL